MSKSTFFTGQPVLNRRLRLMDSGSVRTLARSGKHDRYYRHFDTFTHLVTMLYCVFNRCTSSRELISGMKASHHKLQHVGIRKTPGRSTLCDANQKRSIYGICSYLYRNYRSRRQKIPSNMNCNS